MSSEVEQHISPILSRWDVDVSDLTNEKVQLPTEGVIPKGVGKFRLKLQGDSSSITTQRVRNILYENDYGVHYATREGSDIRDPSTLIVIVSSTSTPIEIPSGR